MTEIEAATLAENRQRDANVSQYLDTIHRRWKQFRFPRRSKINLRLDLYYTLKNFPGSDVRFLAEAPDGVFAHDMLGIMEHLCREPGANEGKMMANFLPKFVSIDRRVAAQKAEVRA